MAVGLKPLPELTPVPGIRLGTASAGIRKANRRDLVVIAYAPDTRTAAVFTRNRFCAAPVILARRHLEAGAPQALLINTGFANAGTGDQGERDALACCEALARQLNCRTTDVLPFSTGVIGEALPVNRVVAGIPVAVEALRADGWQDAAHGIMTTDTLPKGYSRQVEIGGKIVTVTGIAKGAGMIRPDMATLLAFVATDAAVSQAVLQQCIRQVVEGSFNRITVDGDTSTNDSCVLLASGLAGNVPIAVANGADYEAFRAAVGEVFSQLAQMIVRDAEGATKFITIDVVQGASERDCLEAAYTIAHSPLVKTAFFASDPNWGRILAALGRAPMSKLDVGRVNVFINDVCIVHHGARAPTYTEAQGQAVMGETEIVLRIELGVGPASARVWTCDLSHDYVRINAEYRS